MNNPTRYSVANFFRHENYDYGQPSSSAGGGASSRLGARLTIANAGGRRGLNHDAFVVEEDQPMTVITPALNAQQVHEGVDVQSKQHFAPMDYAQNYGAVPKNQNSKISNPRMTLSRRTMAIPQQTQVEQPPVNAITVAKHRKYQIRETLGFVPMSYVDDVVTEVNGALQHALSTVEQELENSTVDPTTIIKAILKLEQRYQTIIDQAFDSYEKYVQQNIFGVRRPYVLPKYRGARRTLEDEANAIAAVEAKRKRLASLLYYRSKIDGVTEVLEKRKKALETLNTRYCDIYKLLQSTPMDPENSVAATNVSSEMSANNSELVDAIVNGVQKMDLMKQVQEVASTLPEVDLEDMWQHGGDSKPRGWFERRLLQAMSNGTDNSRQEAAETEKIGSPEDVQHWNDLFEKYISIDAL